MAFYKHGALYVPTSIADFDPEAQARTHDALADVEVACNGCDLPPVRADRAELGTLNGYSEAEYSALASRTLRKYADAFDKLGFAAFAPNVRRAA